MLDVRNSAPAILSFLDAKKTCEYSMIMEDLLFKDMIKDLSEEITKIGGDSLKSSENSRLFVGEYIWALYIGYYKLHLRIAMLLFGSSVTGVFNHWFEDSLFLDVIESVIQSKEKMDCFRILELGHYDWLQREYEGLFLRTINDLLSGTITSNFSVEHAAHISRTVAQMNMHNA